MGEVALHSSYTEVKGPTPLCKLTICYDYISSDDFQELQPPRHLCMGGFLLVLNFIYRFCERNLSLMINLRRLIKR